MGNNVKYDMLYNNNYLLHNHLSFYPSLKHDSSTVSVEILSVVTLFVENTKSRGETKRFSEKYTLRPLGLFCPGE